MMGMTRQETERAVAMWGIALCLFAAAAGWMFMRFGMAWSVADLPPSGNMNSIVPAYIVAEVAMIPLGGKLIDMYGCRRMLAVAPFFFILGSMMCILSASVEMLIVFRFVQGIGGGLILALAFTAVGKHYEPTKRGKCHELMTASFAFGSLFGSAMGYFLTSNFNWRFGFVFFSLLMFIGFIMAWKLLPHDEPTKDSADIVGLVLTSLLFGIAALYTQSVNVDFDLISAPSVVFVIIIVILLYGLFKHSRTYFSPVIPVGITAFEKKLIVLMFMFSLCGLGLIQYFFKLYLTFYEFDIYIASSMFIFLILGAAGPSMLGCRKVFATGIRPWVTVGSIIVTASLIVVHFIADKGVMQFGLSLFIFGFGLGCIVTEILCSLQSVVEKRDMGQHTGNLMAVRMIGILVGNAIVGSYIADVTRANAVPSIIDVNTTQNLIKDIASHMADAIHYAANSLDDGLMTTVVIMAVITAVLVVIAFKIGKDDVDALSEEDGEQ